MIYTRRFWRHTSVLATRSFGQGVVVALGGDVFNVWNSLDAKGILFAGAGMAAASVAMSFGRVTVSPRQDTPPELVEINRAIDAVFADAYTDEPPMAKAPQRQHVPDFDGRSDPDVFHPDIPFPDVQGLPTAYPR